MVGNKTRVWGLKRVVQVTACVTLAVLSLGLGLTLINFVVGNAGNAHDSGYLGSTKVPGRGDGESLLVAEVDPIDKLLSTPSPYETILTDSRPKARKSRQSSTSQRPVQKKNRLHLFRNPLLLGIRRGQKVRAAIRLIMGKGERMSIPKIRALPMMRPCPIKHWAGSKGYLLTQQTEAIPGHLPQRQARL